MIIAIWILACMTWLRSLLQHKHSAITTGALLTLASWQRSRTLGIVVLIITAIVVIIKAVAGHGVLGAIAEASVENKRF